MEDKLAQNETLKLLQLNYCFICLSKFDSSTEAKEQDVGTEPPKLIEDNHVLSEKEEFEILIQYLIRNSVGNSAGNVEVDERFNKIITVLLNLYCGEDSHPDNNSEHVPSLKEKHFPALLCAKCENKVKAIIDLHMQLEAVKLKLACQVENLKKLVISKSMFGDDETVKTYMSEMESLLEGQGEDDKANELERQTRMMKTLWIETVRDFQAAVFESSEDNIKFKPHHDYFPQNLSIPEDSGITSAGEEEVTVKEEPTDEDEVVESENVTLSTSLPPLEDFVSTFMESSIWSSHFPTEEQVIKEKKVAIARSESTEFECPKQSPRVNCGDAKGLKKKRKLLKLQEDTVTCKRKLPQIKTDCSLNAAKISEIATKMSTVKCQLSSPNPFPDWNSIRVRCQEKKKPRERRKQTKKRTRLICESCPFSVLNKFDFIQHLREHETDNKMYECQEPTCEERWFSEKQYFEYHMKLHKVDYHFWICNICKVPVPAPTYTNHLRSHVESIFTCPFCYFAHQDLLHFSNHLDNHKTKERVLKCVMCSSSFKGTNGLVEWKTHLIKDHNCQELLLKCSYENCSETFISGNTLRSHLYKHIGRYACSICGEKLPNTNLLNLHIKKQHLKQNIFECGVGDCTESFKTEGRVERHRIERHDYKMFKCEICPDVQYFHSNSLSSHHKRHHRDKVFPCEVCSKIFKTVALLNHHSLSHRERNVVCDQCGHITKSTLHLRRHKKIHQEVPRYKCSFCSKRFHEKRNAEDHERTHTGDRPFICHLCSAAFAKKQAMTNHIKKHHENS